jgi:hypothetical protein
VHFLKSLILAGLLLIPGLAEAQMADSLQGAVTKSANRKKGGTVSFTGLRSDRPSVTWPGVEAREARKVHQGEDLIVLFVAVADSGDGQVYYIYPKVMRFVLVEIGALEARIREHEYRPQLTFGTLH